MAGRSRLHETARQAVLEERSALELAQPRSGLVLETPGGPPTAPAAPASPGLRAVFAQEEGPLAGYQRTVELTPLPDGRFRARQVVGLEVGLPWWSWLLALPLRRSLSRWPPPTTTAAMPWWAPPDRLGRRPACVMATLAALVAVQGFMAGLLPETLSYAGSEMHFGTFGQGIVFGAVELSTLPALLALAAADRRGRRRVVLWATAGAVCLSELTALSPGVTWLAGSQVAVGAMLAAAGIAATVIAVEEVPKGCRAWSLGILAMAGGFGAGVPLALLPLAGLGRGGWRWLYWLSLACLPVVWRCARQLPESRRWTFPRERGPAAFRQLWTRRLGLVCTGAALFALFATPALQFETQFLRHERHYSALAISVLEQLAGTVGAIGVLFGGRLADTRGRRPVAAASVVGATALAVAFYLSRSGLMWLTAVAAQFFFYATGPALGVYGAELFATPARARSAGLVSAAAAVGGVIGTVATGGLADVTGRLGPALAFMAFGPVIVVVLLVVAYPETAAVELDQLNPSDGLVP